MKTVPIVLDRDRNLGFNLAAARKFKTLSEGVSLSAAIMRTDDKPSDLIDVDTVSKLLFAGLVHEDPGLQLGEVDEMIELVIERDGNIAPLVDKLYEAIVGSGLTVFKLEEKRKGKGSTS